MCFWFCAARMDYAFGPCGPFLFHQNGNQIEANDRSPPKKNRVPSSIESERAIERNGKAKESLLGEEWGNKYLTAPWRPMTADDGPPPLHPPGGEEEGASRCVSFGRGFDGWWPEGARHCG